MAGRDWALNAPESLPTYLSMELHHVRSFRMDGIAEQVIIYVRTFPLRCPRCLAWTATDWFDRRIFDFDMATKLILAFSALSLTPIALASPRGPKAAAAQVVHATDTGPSSGSATYSTSAPPVVDHPTSLPHTPFSGSPTVTGALNASSTGSGISSQPAPPAATTYPSDGKLQDAAPAPFVPAGGVGTNGTTPIYNVKSDFDYESLVCHHCCSPNRTPELSLTSR